MSSMRSLTVGATTLEAGPLTRAIEAAEEEDSAAAQTTLRADGFVKLPELLGGVVNGLRRIHRGHGANLHCRTTGCAVSGVGDRAGIGEARTFDAACRHYSGPTPAVYLSGNQRQTYGKLPHRQHWSTTVQFRFGGSRSRVGLYGQRSTWVAIVK
jgi:hypothetical protein